MINPNDILKIPVEQATRPGDGNVVWASRWWVVEDDCLLIYRGVSPQCNVDKRVVDRLAERLDPGAEVKFFEYVYLSVSGLDYNSIREKE